MSENDRNSNNLDVNVRKSPVGDFSDRDLEAIKKYEDEGLPNIATFNEEKLTQIMNAYLSGKTYPQIASAVRSQKAAVMYLSKKYGWPQMRRDYLIEVEKSIANRLIENKIESQDFLLNLIQTWQEQMGKKMKKYISSGDEKFINEIDLKVLDKYLKTLEILHKNGYSSGDSKNPTVGLNLGSGVTVKKINESEVEITPKEKTLASMLKKLADERREEELKKAGNMPEISIEKEKETE